MKKKIGFIGAGNMTRAIVQGLVTKKVTDTFCLSLYSPSGVSAKQLASDFSLATFSLEESADFDLLVIACKPQQFQEMANSIKPILTTHKHFLSLMAGIPEKTITNTLSPYVTRFMPNTPIAKSLGTGLVLHSDEVKTEQKELVELLLSPISQNLVCQDETMFDELTPVLGSGPAYIFYFISLFSEMLINKGISKDLAPKLATELFRGSSELAKDTSNLEELIDKVCSKGGVTIEAVNHYRSSDLKSILEDGVSKAIKRSQELAKL